MIALLIESLLSSGLKEFQVSIGDADYYKGICEEAGIDDETEEMIREQSHQWEMKYENIYLCINRERMRKSISFCLWR